MSSTKIIPFGVFKLFLINNKIKKILGFFSEDLPKILPERFYFVGPTNGTDCRDCYCNKIPTLLCICWQISGSKSLEALSEVDELAPPVPKKGSKPDLTFGISPESIRRRPTKLHHRSSSPADMLRTVTSPVQPPSDKYDSLDLSIRHFRVAPVASRIS